MDNINIEFTRGDTFKKKVLTHKNDEDYIPSEGDTIVFAAKKSYTENQVAVEINVPADTGILEIRPENTKQLKYGVYVYEVELTTADGEVHTIIKGRMTLLPEVR